MNALTIATATLVAAVIAAIASVVVLIANLYAHFTAELRVAHRETLSKDLADLGEALHQILACADIMLRAKSDESRARWLSRCKDAASSLKGLRRKLRYPLWGLDEGLRVLSHVPDWVDHARVNPSRAKELVARADNLRRSLDNTIRKSYRSGRCPSLWERWSVSYQASRCRNFFTKGKLIPPDEEIAQPLDAVASP